MIRRLNRLLGKFDIRVTHKSSFEKLLQNINMVQDLDLLRAIEPEQRANCVEYLNLSKSALRQDLFTLSELGFKKNGYFVEFGATNGVENSNSYLLESEFGWNGILAEPARMWHADLKKNRAANIEINCVWKNSGDTLTFNETEVGELSTLDKFSTSDRHRRSREGGTRYDVITISLNDLLEKYNAPNAIDYLSIDTEGSEYEILRELNFEKYKFRVITCEHNYTSNREKIYELLSEHGYKRKFIELSKCDDWYVLIDR